MPNLIEQLEARICKLQTSFVSLQEQFREYQNTMTRNHDDSVLRVIDILDLIETTQSLDSNNDSNFPLIIKKIQKRLQELLRRWQVEEIIFKNGQIEPGKVRVVETQVAPEGTQSNLIMKVCRKGYQRGDKVIRPADVITGRV